MILPSGGDGGQIPRQAAARSPLPKIQGTYHELTEGSEQDRIERTAKENQDFGRATRGVRTISPQESVVNRKIR